jgi:hypothetical protein
MGLSIESQTRLMVTSILMAEVYLLGSSGGAGATGDALWVGLKSGARSWFEVDPEFSVPPSSFEQPDAKKMQKAVRKAKEADFITVP